MKHEQQTARPVVYVIRGPGWVYVGQTKNWAKRRYEHELCLRIRSWGSNQLVHRLLRKAPKRSVTFEVVATSATPVGAVGWQGAALWLEDAVLRQLQAEGETLANHSFRNGRSPPALA